jgi:hypothetical protein
MTISGLREQIALEHKGRLIVGIADQDAGTDPDEPLENWLVRTADTPFRTLASKLGRVILGWRGTEVHMAARANWAKNEFIDAARWHLHCHGRIIVKPQGLDSWEVSARFLYDVTETRKMNITLHDTDRKKHKLRVEGDRSAGEAQEHFRQKWMLSPWNKVVIEPQDHQPFWIEDKSDYSISVICDPDRDTRHLVTIRIDAADRSLIIPDIRADDDPVTLLSMLSSKPGFQFPKAHKLHFEPATPWNS